MHHLKYSFFGGLLFILVQGCGDMPVGDEADNPGDLSVLEGTGFDAAALDEIEQQAVDLDAIVQRTDLAGVAEAIRRSADHSDEAAGKLILPRARIIGPGESIQQALNEASPGTAILVRPGVYREAVTIRTPGLRLIGLRDGQGRRPIIENPGGEGTGVLVLVDGSALVNLEVRGFEENGILLSGAAGFALLGISAIGNGRYGIAAISSAYGLISHCSVSGSADAGLFVFASHHVLLQHSSATRNVLGIEVENASHIIVRRNHSYDNVMGLLAVLVPGFEVKTSTNLVISNNEVSGNNRQNFAEPGTIAGGIPRGIGLGVVGTDHTLVRNNRVINNNFEGIAVASTELLVALGLFPDPGTFDVEPNPDGVSVIGNTARGNGQNPPPLPGEAPPVPAVDLFWDQSGTGNCWEHNTFDTRFPEFLPACSSRNDRAGSRRASRSSVDF